MKQLLMINCPYCNEAARVIYGDELYKNRADLKDLMFYACLPCDAYVGTHKESGEPFGSLANAPLRKARMATHALFDGYWKEQKIKRYDAYRKLRHAMSLSKELCHIGMFDVKQCKQAQKIVREWYGELELPQELQC